MLPLINAQNRPKLSNHGILIRVRLDPNGTSLCILHQPCPARALNACQCGIELLFHGVEGAVGGVDGFGKVARGRVAAAGGFGGEVFPKEGVVYGAAFGMH